MPARDHTRRMLAWWTERVNRADLAILRPQGAMLWVRGRELDNLPLAWARAENARGSEIYIRPARGSPWPLLLLDDLPVDLALRVARRYAALVVHTSPAGGCHLWLAAAHDLDEAQRKACQRHLAARAGADPASTSGEHLGRLAGFRNHKRAGPWVNVLAASALPPWRPPAHLLAPAPASSANLAPARTARPAPAIDDSPSGRDWAWTCRQLERGSHPDVVRAQLTTRCRSRRGHDAERYAHLTVERARRRQRGS